MRKLVSVLFAGTLAAVGSAALAQDDVPIEWMPWKDPNNPNVIVLHPETADKWNVRRDRSGDPSREAGPINLQRYTSGVSSHGFPTFFNAPIALTPEDLRAGEVDVAVFGSAADAQYLQGAKYAANKMRVLSDVTFWPEGAGTDPYNRMDYQGQLNIVDYGNAAANILHNQRTLEEITQVIREIQSGGAVPMSVGGTHQQMYAWIMALAAEHGPGNFAMFHIDAHYDSQAPSYGIFVHNGSMIRNGIEAGLINGPDIVQFGLRSPVPIKEELDWMRSAGMRYHFMAEVERNGMEAVVQRIFGELEDRKLFISVDMDGIDPAAAPAVGSQEPGGPSVEEAARLLRGLAASNDVVGLEFGEYNPLVDDAHTTTGIAMDRLMRAALAGMTARKNGLTDPNYIDPVALDHGVPDPE